MRTFIFSFRLSHSVRSPVLVSCFFVFCSSLKTHLYYVHVHGLFLLFRKRTAAIAWYSARIAMKHNTFHETSYLLFFHVFIVMFGILVTKISIDLPHTQITQPSIDIDYKFIFKSRREKKKKYPEIQTGYYIVLA